MRSVTYIYNGLPMQMSVPPFKNILLSNLVNVPAVIGLP